MWRDTPQLIALVHWVEQTPACAALRQIGEAQPLALLAVQALHLFGICAVVAVGWLTGLWLLRAVDLPQALGASPARLLRSLVPAITLLAVTGLLLIVRRPDRILLSAAFPIKLALIAVGLGLAFALSRTLAADSLYWERTPGRRRAARALGLACILIWTATVFAGRWIPFA